MTPLAQALIALRDNGPRRAEVGICFNLPCEFREQLYAHMPNWPEYSGRLAFPVPAPGKDDPKIAYLGATECEMWDPRHPYGAARLRLLNWLIEQELR